MSFSCVGGVIALPPLDLTINSLWDTKNYRPNHKFNSGKGGVNLSFQSSTEIRKVKPQ